MEKPYVYVAGNHHTELHKLIEQQLNVVEDDSIEQNRHKVTALFVFVSRLTVEIMSKFPSLRVIGTCSVGYDNINLEECKARGIRVGNTPNTLNDTTADMGIALLLSVARRVLEGDKICKDPTTTGFDSTWYGFQVSGTTAGIIGMGRIGLEVAKRLRGFDMQVLYYGRTRKPVEIESLVNATYVPSLHEMLGQCDYVIIVAPATKETHHMMGRDEFKAMKDTAILINIARGSLVDQEALIEALKNKEISGAGLDVTDPEPLPRDHQLLTFPNVIITPHTGSATFQTRKRMVQMTIDNILAGVNGKDMPGEINLS